MHGNSPEVVSNQTGIHPDLIQVVNRHFNSRFQKRITSEAMACFESLQAQLSRQNRPMILDSGCGTAYSTRMLAEQYPQCWVIGVDKSAHRLSKMEGEGTDSNNKPGPQNLVLLNMNLIDLWSLAAQEQWRFDHHYLLYPNPWPKKKHLKRRWQGHAILPTLIQVSQRITLRTNWRIYYEEWKALIEHCGWEQTENFRINENSAPWSLFEKKYLNSGHELFHLSFFP